MGEVITLGGDVTRVAKDASNLDGPDVDAWREALNLVGDDGLPVSNGSWVRAGGPISFISLVTQSKDYTTAQSLAATSHHPCPHLGGASYPNATPTSFNNVLYLRRFFLQPCLIDRVAFRQVAQGVAGSTTDVGFWAPDSTLNPAHPGSLLVSASIAGDTGGANVNRAFSVNYEHPGGWGWVGFVHHGLAGFIMCQETGGWPIPQSETGGLPTSLQSQANALFLASITGVGALPNSLTWAPGGAIAATPSLTMRIAA